MSLTYGFYNSINEDRKYNASQLSKLFDGVLNDGIFMSIGDKFMVTANTGMNISIGTGRAWFNHTWTYNDSILVLPVSVSEILLNRIDIVVLEVNNTEAVRANSIKIIKGAGATIPVPPELVNNSEIHQYPLAHIYVGVGVTEILQANITNKVGLSETPFATGVMQGMNIDALVAQWQSEWDVWSAEQQADYISWFNNINALLGTEPATNLQVQVSAHDVRLADLEYDARIAYIAEKIRDRNIIKNGDLRNGLTGWTSYMASSTLEAGEIVTYLSGNWPAVYQEAPVIAGNKVYVSAKMKTSNTGRVFRIYLGIEYGDTPILATPNEWTNVSGIVTPVTTPANFEMKMQSADAGETYRIKNTILGIPITSIFGAGNEPTKEETDAAIELLGGWTDVPLRDKYLTGYNLGANIGSLTNKDTPVDADMVAIADSAASNASKKLTWANIKATLKTYFDTLYNNYSHPTSDGNLHVPATGTTNNGKVLKAGATAGSLVWGTVDGYVHPTVDKATPVDADNVAISDSAASGALKKLTWANIKATLKTYFDSSYLRVSGGGQIMASKVQFQSYTTIGDYNPSFNIESTAVNGQAAGIALHRPGVYGINFGLDTDNSVKLGGWSHGQNAFRFISDTSGNFTASGNITAYSDERLKENIVTIPNALDKVLALRGVEFDRNGVHNIGLIAQEVQKVIPEIVLENSDEMKTLSVAYANLVGLLIEAIKEQQTQIDELKAKVN